MKSKIKRIVLVFVMAALCGCGASQSRQSEIQHADRMQSAPPAVDAVFKNSEASAKENRLENDFIRVWAENLRFDESSVWMQENLDGTEKKTMDIEHVSCVLWLTNDWVYYSCEENGHQSVYRVPAVHKEGAAYDISGRERLFEVKTDGEDIRDAFFVTDTYIFYSRFDEDSEMSTYYRYDMEAGTSTEAFTLEADDAGVEAEMIQNECTNLPVMLENSFFLSSDTGIWRVYFDTLEKKRICAGKELVIGDMAEHEGAVYFCGTIDGGKDGVAKVGYSGQSLLKYDGKSEEITSVLTDRELKNVLEQVQNTAGTELIDENCYYTINAPYTYKNRLYIQVHTEAGAKAYTQKSGKNVLLSASFDNLGQWEIETALTGYCLEQGMGDEARGVNGASVIEEVCDGKVLFSVTTGVEEPASPFLSSVKFQGYYAVYNIDTGEIEKLADGDHRICGYYY